jgi:hypothetical protein
MKDKPALEYWLNISGVRFLSSFFLSPLCPNVCIDVVFFEIHDDDDRWRLW